MENTNAIYEVTNAVIEAYKTYLSDDRFPITVINITIDPTLVDVIETLDAPVPQKKIEDNNIIIFDYLLLINNNICYEDINKTINENFLIQ